MSFQKYMDGLKPVVTQKLDAIKDLVTVKEFDYAEVVLSELEAILKDIRRAVRGHKEGEL